MLIIKDTKVLLNEKEKAALSEMHFLLERICQESNNRDLCVSAKGVLIFLELFENEHLED